MGVTIGLGAAVPIGPVNVQIARRALSQSWGAGACLGLGAVTVDVVYACLATAGVRVAGNSPYVYWPVAIVGTGVLAYLGFACVREAARAYRSGWGIDEEAPRTGAWRTYGTGVMMTASNPMTLAFWFGGLSSSAASAGVAPAELPHMALGVFAGTVSWVLVFSTGMSLLGRFRKPWWLAAADLAGGVVLLGFAGVSAWRCLSKISASS